MPRFEFLMKTGGNTAMFLVVAEQCLHRAKNFSAFHAALTVRRLGMHEELGGDTTTTDEPNLTE